MLPLARQIRLRNGIELSTPLLIPSLSSRAVGLMPSPSSPSSQPELIPCSMVHSELLVPGIEESILVSAYDICHDFLADSNAFRSGFLQSQYAQPQILFIDSGLYEKYGSSPDKQFGNNQYESLQWEKSDYKCTIDNLDADMRPIVVSWDHFGSYTEQIAAGQEFFCGRTAISPTLLLKPPGNVGVHDFDKFSADDFVNLQTFDVIGVTEKEIGDSVLDRLFNIAQLRRCLDSMGVKSPIHIFGGLDPLYTPLYFAAGGELFDGLGWLRYAYREGVAMHRDAAAILGGQITELMNTTLVSMCLQNLAELRRLSEELGLLAKDHRDWTHIVRGDRLKPIFRTLQEQLGEQ